MSEVTKLLAGQERLSLGEANLIARAVDTDPRDILAWLDSFQASGAATPAELRMAAIVRGILIRLNREPM